MRIFPFKFEVILTLDGGKMKYAMCVDKVRLTFSPKEQRHLAARRYVELT